MSVVTTKPRAARKAPASNTVTSAEKSAEAYDPFADITQALSWTNQAAEVLRLAAEELDDDALQAVKTLVLEASGYGGIAAREQCRATCEDFSCALRHPEALIEAMKSQYADEEGYFAAESLLSFAQARICEVIGKLPEAQQ